MSLACGQGWGLRQGLIVTNTDITEHKRIRQGRAKQGIEMKGKKMNNETKCLRCGGKNVMPSHVQSTGRIYTRPKEANFLGILKTGTHVNALTCLDCGHVELFVDVKKTKAMLKTA